MISLKYKVSRFLFGFFITLIALRSLTQPQIGTLSTLLQNNLKEIHSENGIISLINFSFLTPETNSLIRSKIDLSQLSDNSEDTVQFIYILLLIGGVLCIFGQPISKFFIVSSLILDVILLHNIKFFVSDSSKGIMLKYFALIGGAVHIA